MNKYLVGFSLPFTDLLWDTVVIYGDDNNDALEQAWEIFLLRHYDELNPDDLDHIKVCCDFLK